MRSKNQSLIKAKQITIVLFLYVGFPPLNHPVYRHNSKSFAFVCLSNIHTQLISLSLSTSFSTLCFSYWRNPKCNLMPSSSIYTDSSQDQINQLGRLIWPTLQLPGFWFALPHHIIVRTGLILAKVLQVVLLHLQVMPFENPILIWSEEFRSNLAASCVRRTSISSSSSSSHRPKKR